ncbi:MAG: TonB-dependent receptor, partial [Gemmatimonadota bacterium]|nr:TonB-dependent receptor [Gemmatimonadota bacterium]
MITSRFVQAATRAARRLAIALAFVAFGAVGATAQNTGTVTGLVRDAVSLAPLAGAQVSIEGTGIGGLANNVGRFLLLNVPAGQHTVNVTLIGYGQASETVTVTAGQTATVNFGLRETALALEGVIVTGTAGQARRREVGNVVESISSADIELAAITSASEVLQGRAAGLQITSTDGQVGSGTAIRIRGNSSLSQNNTPLIYIDGVRMENDPLVADDESGTTPNALDGINPSDIERVEVVKGPAATTLYGTEAAGGVIQIFTKRGSAGAPAWSLNVDGGMTVMGHQGPRRASDVGQIQNQYIDENPDLFPSGDLGVDYMLPSGSIGNENGLRLNDCSSGEDMSMYATIDSYDAEPGCPASGSWFRDAIQQRYNLSVRGGGETATYFVSGRWAREEGVVDPQGQDSYNLRANVQFQPLDGLDISLNNMYTRRNTVWIPNGNNASGLFLNVLRGDRGYTPGNDDSLVLVNDIESYVNQWVTSASIGWSPTASFSHRLNFGMDYSYSDFIDFKPFGNYENPEGDREADQATDRNMTFDYNGSWRTDVTDNISSAFSWGGQVYEEYNGRLNGFDAVFAGPGEQLLGDGTLPGLNEGRLTIRSGGFFLQEQVGLSDRLFVTGGVRWDGFSTFGEGFGLAAYPKLSAAWTISEESFFPEIGALDAMKLRGAWGKSGRAPGAFDAVKIYEATQADEFVPAVVIGNLGNADLGPEISQELEAG